MPNRLQKFTALPARHEQFTVVSTFSWGGAHG
jgi:hypothetical protein